ncbi:MAG: hypothetical protein ACRESC_05010 [Gammaproteobacteria bacterium]
MPDSSRRISNQTRSRLHAVVGICFIVAGILNLTAIPDSSAKWLLLSGLVGVGVLYFLISYLYRKKSPTPDPDGAAE